MIRVVKPATAPEILRTKGKLATQVLCDAYAAAPRDYQAGRKTFEFDRVIYAADEVKKSLQEAQHKKCAFCESYFAHTGYGDVEHFRPKAGYQQKSSDKLKRPGYYWLAYAWENLFYSCQLCNQRFKRNLFPLKDGRRRARTHQHQIAKEDALLIHPEQVDPAKYLGFREHYAFAIDDCVEGTTTIEVLGLNREELTEVRYDRMEDLKTLIEIIVTLRQELMASHDAELSERLNRHEKRLRAKTQVSAEYSAMVSTYCAHALPQQDMRA